MPAPPWSPPPFAAQRTVCLALVLGMLGFAIVAAVVLQQNGGDGLADARLDALDTVVIACCAATLPAALLTRAVLMKRADRADQPVHARQRWAARLVPLVMLDVCGMFALTVWLLTGAAVPSLVAALVVIAVAIAIVPMHDVDAAK